LAHDVRICERCALPDYLLLLARFPDRPFQNRLRLLVCVQIDPLGAAPTVSLPFTPEACDARPHRRGDFPLAFYKGKPYYYV
jgi:hypothetical protein